MMTFFRRLAEIALRVIIASACGLGVWCSWQFAYADYQYHKDTEESVHAAIHLVPDNWEYSMRLAQFDREHYQDLLDTSLRLNPYNAQADIELGLQYEADGKFSQAEKSLLAAFEVDHTYLPRWSLTNYYFRRGNMPAFWAWARSAAEMPGAEIRPLFELCWRVSPSPEKISETILNQKPELTRQYIDFLLAKNQLHAVADIAPRLVRFNDPDTDRPLLFSVVDHLVAVNDAAAAGALWHLLMEQHWVVADTTVPNNAAFERKPVAVSFDWSLPEYTGLHSWPGSSGLEAEFTGSQPEESLIADQAVLLSPGNYTLTYAYHTSDIPPSTGIRWQIFDPKSNSVLASSSDLSSDTLQNAVMPFSVPTGSSLLRLRLNYQRTLGTPRISGMLMVLSTKIQVQP